MRFDLLDEYSTLVPFGLGVPRSGVFHNPAIAAEAASRSAVDKFAGKPVLPRKLLEAFRRMTLSSYRNLVARCSCLF
jgi:hypothetical protein